MLETCLLCKCEGLSSIPRTHIKNNRGMRMFACVTSAGAKTGRFLALIVICFQNPPLTSCLLCEGIICLSAVAAHPEHSGQAENTLLHSPHSLQCSLQSPSKHAFQILPYPPCHHYQHQNGFQLIFSATCVMSTQF